MTFSAYLDYFQKIINNPNPPAPYDNPEYIEYTKLNWSRMNRWLKHGEIDAALKTAVAAIDRPEQWIIITEPWCGDAAHLVPFMERIGSLNPKITKEYELRDSEPYSINQYLTNGKSKSIPILIVKNKQGKDIFHWGPRPKEAQELYKNLKAKNANFEETKITLQKWYNEDKGKMFQDELKSLLQKTSA